MAQGAKDIFPLYFTVESCEGGFILHPRGQNKKVVMKEQIQTAVGKLFHFDTLNIETPVVYRVQAMSLEEYAHLISIKPDDFMDQKVDYVNLVLQEKLHQGHIIVIKNDQNFEIVGDQVVRVLADFDGSLDQFVVSVGGHRVIILPASKENGQMLAKMYSNNNKLCLLELDKKKFMEKIQAHHVIMNDNSENK